MSYQAKFEALAKNHENSPKNSSQNTSEKNVKPSKKTAKTANDGPPSTPYSKPPLDADD